MTRVALIAALAVIAALLAAGPSRAFYPHGEEPKVEYSADMVVERGAVRHVHRVFYRPEMERREMDNGAVLVVRRDMNLMWMLTARSKMYVEHRLSDDHHPNEGDPDEFKVVERVLLGEDTLDGVKTLRYSAVIEDANKERIKVLMWARKEDGIVVKTDSSASGADEKKRLVMELKNLVVGKQPSFLFEIPAGYKKMSMDSAPGGTGAAVPGVIRVRAALP